MRASDMSFGHRLSLVLVAIAAAFALSGSIFGFQALRPALIDAGVYRSLCELDEPVPCNAQLLRLNLVFTIATTMANAASIVIGFVLDHYGPRFTAICGCLLYTLGSFLFGISSEKFPLYMLSYSLIGVGGPFVFISSIHLSLAFPLYGGLVMAALTGAFDSSAILYNFFQYIRAITGFPDIHNFFLIYTGFPVLFAIAFSILMPKESLTHHDTHSDTLITNSDGSPLVNEQSTNDLLNVNQNQNNTLSSAQTSSLDADGNLESDYDSNEEYDEDEAVDYEDGEETSVLLPHGSNYEDIESKSVIQISGPTRSAILRRQLFSWEYLLLTFTISLYMLKLNFYISTIKEQLTSLASPEFEDNIQSLLEYFNWALPIGGIVAMPFVGILLDKCSHFISFAVLGGFGIAFSLFGMMNFLPIQVATITIFSIMRPLLYTLGNDYSAKSFGFITFGRVYGIMNLTAAVVNTLQYGLAWISMDVTNGSFFVVNLLLLLCTIIALVFPMYLKYTSTPERRRFLTGGV